MSAILNSIFEPISGPVTWALLHFTWQGGLVAAVLAGVLFAQRRSSPVVRYRTACFALLLMVVLPAVTICTYDSTGTAGPGGLGNHSPALVTGESVADGADRPPEESVESSLSSGSNTTDETNYLPTLGFTLPSLDRLRPWVFAAWLAGVVLLSVIHVSGWRKVQKLKVYRTEPAPQEWRKAAAKLCRELGIQRAVRVLVSAWVEVPTVIGWLSPVVLIPAATLTGLSPRQLQSLLAHELAHVKRRDYLVNLLQVVAETLLFFHPAVWWVSRQIRDERENCCDDIAVTVTNNRATYARALVRLEELRTHNPGFAMRADGGSLIHRVRRLIGGQSMSISKINHPRLTGVILTFVLILCGSVFTLAAGRTAGDAAESVPPVQGEVELAALAQEDRDDDAGSYRDAESRFTVEGEWEIERIAGIPMMRMETGTRFNRNNFTIRFNEDEFDGLDYGRGDEFVLRRDAGTFYFIGDFDRSSRSVSGDGDFGFVPARDFEDDLEELGTRGLTDRRQLILAAQDVGVRYLKELRSLGYSDISADMLVKLAIHGVTLDFIHGMENLGYKNLSLSQMVKMRIHGVSPEYVKEMEDLGYDRVSAGVLVKWRIHGVSPEYIHEMSELGYSGLDADDLVKMRIHGVNPEFVRETHELGYDHLSVDKLVKWRIHNVSPHFIKEMDELGYPDLDEDELVKMRIHGVSPEFVREMRELGYDRVSANKLIKWRIHGVSPEYIRAIEELGYKHVDDGDLVRMRIHGVTPSYIKRVLANFREKPTVEDLIKLKIHGIL